MRGSFKDREADRVDYQIPVYGHNDHLFFDGHSLSLSANGALLMLNTPLMLPGQELLIHFRGQPGTRDAFNARVQIVRKNFAKTRMNVKSGLHYAVRFTEISKLGNELLLKLIKDNFKERQQ
jgi:hypothetical protein